MSDYIAHTITVREPRHMVVFLGPNHRPMLTLDFDADPVAITVTDGVTMTEAAQHFLAECRRLCGGSAPRS